MQPRTVLAVPVHPGNPLALLEPLRHALSGLGPTVAPHPHDRPPPSEVAAPLRDDEIDPEDSVAAIVSTTGSTGAAKHVLLPASAMLASAEATNAYLGGPGRWLLAIPAHTVAGVQVLTRCLVAATRPSAMDLSAGFDVDGFYAAAAEFLQARGPGRRYTSLVPAQLQRLVNAPGTGGDKALDALSAFDAVLVGGGALDADLRARAEDAEVRIITTYGMTETCGGCVYDGVPLPGVQVHLEPDPADSASAQSVHHHGPAPGRVVIAGPVLARGYRNATTEPAGEGFVVSRGRRQFRTADLGVLRDGVLVLHGRTDDVIIAGGTNVSLDAVTRLVTALPDVDDCLAVGLADAAWGHVVGLVVQPVRNGPGPSDDDLRALVRSQLGRAATPAVIRRTERLPLTGVGKPDRAAVANLLREDPGAVHALGLSDHGPRSSTGPEEAR